MTTQKGNSGSPVIRMDEEGVISVVAIHQGENSQKKCNRSIIFENSVFERLKVWKK